jgi:hypothetical protein
MLPQPQNSSAISIGKIVDIWAKLPQAHMNVESQYILIVLEMCAHGKSYLKHICTWNLNIF